VSFRDLLKAVQPLRGQRLLRRLLAEQRLQRRALERIADALELRALPAETVAGRVFRSMTSTRQPLNETEVHDLTEVAYCNSEELAAMLDAEDQLRAVLGRDPSPEEIMRAYQGEAP